ncbi:MAG TPA: hypothetical protein PKN88_09940 [Bacillota bacterium]|nr:hypothetical protein [Bacillota bacterium]
MYSSDLCLVTTPRGYSLLMDMATDGTLTGVVLDGLKEILDKGKAEFFPKEKYILIKWDDINWNLDGKSEKGFYEALKELTKRDVAYKFLRIGELPEDIEEKRNGRAYLLPDLYVTRRIEVWPDDGPGEDLTFLKDINPICYRKLLLRSAVGFYETV